MSDDGGKGLGFGAAVKLARECFESLGGKRVESVSGATRLDDGGWMVSLDVVELARTPPSTDVLSTYEVTLDPDGDLADMARVRRFTRAQSSED